MVPPLLRARRMVVFLSWPSSYVKIDDSDDESLAKDGPHIVVLLPLLISSSLPSVSQGIC
jgi:hypothetical protein